MTLTIALALNTVMIVAVLGALAYVCRIPFRLPASTDLLPAAQADEQAAAERYAA